MEQSVPQSLYRHGPRRRSRFSGFLRLAAAAVLLASLIRALDRPQGLLPPLGRFFNPILRRRAGAQNDLWARDGQLTIPGLKGRRQSARTWRA